MARDLEPTVQPSVFTDPAAVHTGPIWRRNSLTNLMTEDRAWSIAKVVIGGQPRYELWRRNPARFVASFTTADEAKTYHAANCEAKP